MCEISLKDWNDGVAIRGRISSRRCADNITMTASDSMMELINRVETVTDKIEFPIYSIRA